MCVFVWTCRCACMSSSDGLPGHSEGAQQQLESRLEDKTRQYTSLWHSLLTAGVQVTKNTLSALLCVCACMHVRLMLYHVNQSCLNSQLNLTYCIILSWQTGEGVAGRVNCNYDSNSSVSGSDYVDGIAWHEKWHGVDSQDMRRGAA